MEIIQQKFFVHAIYKPGKQHVLEFTFGNIPLDLIVQELVVVVFSAKFFLAQYGTETEKVGTVDCHQAF